MQGKKKLPISTFVPKGKNLYRYQKLGVKWLVARARSYLADEMGLGKTIQVLVALNYWRPTYCVIIAPAVALATWEQEIKEWTTYVKHVDYIMHGKQLPTKKAQVIIISYGIAVRPRWIKFLRRKLFENPNSVVVFDEAHYLKSWAADRTQKLILNLGPVAPRGIAISGTPISKFAGDIHPLASFCEPGKWGRYGDFVEQYSNRVETPYGVDYKGLKNAAELRQRLQSFWLRRYKKDVQKDLPSKVYANIVLDLQNPELEKQSKPFVRQAIALARGEPFIMSLTDRPALSALRRDIGIAKVKPAIDWIEERLSQNETEPLIVFGYHREPLNKIYKHFDLSYDCGLIDGRVTKPKRAEIVREFKAGNKQLMFLNILAAGVAINLTRANTAIITELDWRPDAIFQAIDRLHRIGQLSTVYIYFLLARNTIDEQIIKVIRNKLRDIGKLTDDTETLRLET